MAYHQWVVPNTNATDDTGMCLRFAQRVFQNLNPIYYNSAWDAWQAAKHKHTGNVPLDVAVPVWFSHYGTYGSPSTYANWGHVVVWIPGHGYISSPAGGHGQQWFSNVEEIERTFNARYVGWSLDIGGLKVAWPKNLPISQPQQKPASKPIIEEDPMPIRHQLKNHNPNQTCKPGTWTTVNVGKGAVSILAPGAKARVGTAHVAIQADGEFDMRLVYDTVDPAKDTVVKKSTGSVHARFDRFAAHAWPIYLGAKGKGDQQRIRVQVKPTGQKAVRVTAVRPIVDYWEK